jgi:hypothetical protein
MSYYIHNVPGRLRIKSPIVRRNDNAASDIRKGLSEMSGIATVDINLTLFSREKAILMPAGRRQTTSISRRLHQRQAVCSERLCSEHS